MTDASEKPVPAEVSVPAETLDAATSKRLKRGFGLSLIFGILMIVLGAIAIARPFFAGIAVNFYLGWIFVIGGIIQVIYAVQTRDEGQFFWKLLIGILYFIAGLILLLYPLEGLLTLTWVVGVSVLISGFTQTVWAFVLRPEGDWRWVLFRGLLAIALGIWVLADWPDDAPWLIGLLVGLNLISDGIGIATFSIAARGAIVEAQTPESSQIG